MSDHRATASFAGKGTRKDNPMYRILFTLAAVFIIYPPLGLMLALIVGGTLLNELLRQKT